MPPRPDLTALSLALDWDGDANRLSLADLAHLGTATVRVVDEAAKDPEVVRVATALGRDARAARHRPGPRRWPRAVERGASPAGSWRACPRPTSGP